MQQGNGNICHYCRSAEAQCSCPRAFAGGHICTYLSHKTADEYAAIVKERDDLRAALAQAQADICSSSCIHGPPQPHCQACIDATKALNKR